MGFRMPNADSYRVTEGVLEGVDMWKTKEGLKGRWLVLFGIVLYQFFVT